MLKPPTVHKILFIDKSACFSPKALEITLKHVKIIFMYCVHRNLTYFIIAFGNIKENYFFIDFINFCNVLTSVMSCLRPETCLFFKRSLRPI